MKVSQTLFVVALILGSALSARVSVKNTNKAKVELESNSQYIGYPTPGAPSDAKLKEDIKQIGVLPNGLKLYKWRWNKLAGEKLQLFGDAFGVIAQEAEVTNPEAVSQGEEGYLRVNYNEIFGEHRHQQ